MYGRSGRKKVAVPEVPRRLLNSIAPGRHARLRDLAGLRRVCLTALIALVFQFGLGMILNLYVSVPASDQHASIVQEVETAPLILTVHVLLGIVLICAAAILLVRAIAVRDLVMISLAVAGLGAVRPTRRPQPGLGRLNRRPCLRPALPIPGRSGPYPPAGRGPYPPASRTMAPQPRPTVFRNPGQ
jgi:hypothetical protein